MNRTKDDPAARPFRSVLAATAAILVLALFVAGIRSYRELAVQRARQAALASRISESKARIEALERQIVLLRSDPGTLERVAREDLGMAKPGDIVVRLDRGSDRTAEKSSGGQRDEPK